MSAKIIEIKKQSLNYLISSFFIGFIILFGLEHFGKFTYDYDYDSTVPAGVKPSLTVSVPINTKLRKITFYSFFGNQVKTEGNGFTVADVAMPDGDFTRYPVKCYYYTKSLSVDFMYGICLSISIFLIFMFFSTFKFKLT